MKAFSREILSGVLSPISWNSNDEVTAFSLYTPHDEDVVLEGKNLSEDFEKYKNRTVKIYGHFKQIKSDERIFNVTKVCQLESAA